MLHPRLPDRPALAALLLLAGCVTVPDPRPGTAGPSLEQAATAWVESFASRDPDRITRVFADDAVAHYPGWPRPHAGREANREAWASYFGRREHHPMVLDTVVVAASGDLGYTLGKGLYSHEGDPKATGGRWVAIWRRAEAEWRLVVLTAHSHSDVTSSAFRSR